MFTLTVLVGLQCSGKSTWANNFKENLNAIADREILTLESEWPRDVTVMQWALYDTEGKLLAEAKTDISKATSQVQLTFHGEGSIEKIEESFQ